MSDPAEAVRQVFDQRLLAELTQESNILPVRPDGFGVTVGEFAHANGLSINTVRKLLDAKVEAGQLQRTEMRGRGGGAGWVYHRR